MAVYEQTYKAYAGPLTPAWSRFLILPRHAYRHVFQSKIFVAFWLACFVLTLICAILIYLHYNINALAILKIRVDELVTIDAQFFRVYLAFQNIFAFLLTVLIGTVLISRDTANNALPLYLSRPFSRTEYVIGKMSVLFVLISAVTWIPGMVLFLFQAYLAGAAWLAQNWRVAIGLCLGSWVIMLTYGLLSLAISAWVRWRLAASAAFFGLLVIPAVFGGIVNNLFQTSWGNLLNIMAQLDMVANGLFGLFVQRSGHYETFRHGQRIAYDYADPPLWSAWAVIIFLCVVCLLLLSRKIKAYEVVR